MPGGDGTGPGGMGPMTGRAAGYCAGYPMPGFMNPIAGRGFWGGGRGRGGWGRGWQRAMYGAPAYGGAAPYGAAYGMNPQQPYGPGMGGAAPYGAAYGMPYGMPYGTPYGAPFSPTVSAQQELDGLKGQAEYLEDALDEIKKRMGELEAEGKKK